MDISTTQTEMREILRSPAAFSNWLHSVSDDFRFGGYEPKKDEKGGYTPGLLYCEGTPIAYFLRERGLDKTMSDSTHCYWWEGPQAVSLMLPDYLRVFHKAIGEAPNGKTAKAAL